MDAVGRISRVAGQPETGSGVDPSYVGHVAEVGTVLVAVNGSGEVVGWTAAMASASGEVLSDLFVDPSARGRGVGQALLRRLWPQGPATPGRFTFSSQHPAAMPLYASWGLAPGWPLLYMVGSPLRIRPQHVRTELVGAAEAARHEAEVTGVDRTSDYEYWTRASEGFGLMVRDRSGVVGVGAVTANAVVHLVVAPGAEAVSVTLAALMTCVDNKVDICVPGPHPALRAMLAAGFRVVDYDVHMTTVDVTLPTTWIYSPGLA